MNELPKPDINFEHHFNKCIENKQAALKTVFLDKFNKINQAASDYDILACKSELYRWSSIFESDLKPLTKDELNKLYEIQMVHKVGPGRGVYDEILSNARGKCPFCSLGDPRTLDHYLPKTDYPEFSILPLNLIPCCRDCNSFKHIDSAAKHGEQYIHPYYDKILSIDWLIAQVSYEIDDQPTLVFDINIAVRKYDSELFDRLNFQFEKLDLNHRYSTQSSNELSGKKLRLKEVFEKGNSQGVQSYLQSEANSWLKSTKNSWQTAMYKALALDSRFHQMDWLSS